jgi:hypothetical protein
MKTNWVPVIQCSPVLVF